jgi:hypothetical protein
MDLRPFKQFMQASAHPLTDVEDIKGERSGYNCKEDVKVAYSHKAISEQDSRKLEARGVDRILLPMGTWTAQLRWSAPSQKLSSFSQKLRGTLWNCWATKLKPLEKVLESIATLQTPGNKREVKPF